MMRTALLGAFVATLLALPAQAAEPLVDGDPAAGKTKAQPCAACHGVDGNSFNPVWPKLAEQHSTYTVDQLKAFQSGARQNPLMTAQAAGLSEQDMRDLAAYYATRTLKPGEADPALVDQGSNIYRRGIVEQGVPACAACHGPAGQGNAAAKYPLVGGQHAEYLVAQLKAYASGERKTDPNGMMRDIAGKLTEEQMRAVASFMQGLYPAQLKVD